jgi:hypothetical protein
MEFQSEEEICVYIRDKHQLGKPLLKLDDVTGKTVQKIIITGEEVYGLFTDDTAFYIQARPSWEGTIDMGLVDKFDGAYLWGLMQLKYGRDEAGDSDAYKEYQRLGRELNERSTAKSELETLRRLQLKYPNTSVSVSQ